jgi:hypothetical protein
MPHQHVIVSQDYAIGISHSISTLAYRGTFHTIAVLCFIRDEKPLPETTIPPNAAFVNI